MPNIRKLNLAVLNWNALPTQLEALLNEASPEDLDYLCQELESPVNLTKLISIYAHDRANQKVYHLLTHLRKPAAQEYLCNSFISSYDPLVGEICRAANYAPIAPRRRALFYVITQQWAKYEAFDSDRKLFRAELSRTQGVALEKLLTVLRQSGRTDLLLAIPPAPPTSDSANLNYNSLNLLLIEQEYGKLWELAQAAAPCWAIWILQALQNVGWQPALAAPDLATYTELQTKAAKCTPELIYRLMENLPLSPSALPYPDFEPANSVASQPTNQVLISPQARLVARLEGFDGQPQSRVAIYNYPANNLIEAFQVQPPGVPAVPELDFTPTEFVPLGSEVSAIEITEIIFSRDEQFLTGLGRWNVAGSLQENWGIWVFPLEKQGVVCSTFITNNYRPQKIAVSTSNRWIAVSAKDRLILYRFNQSQLTEADSVFFLHHAMPDLQDIAFSPDEQTLALGFAGGKIQLINVPGLRTQREYETKARTISHLHFSPDQKMLVFGPELSWLALEEEAVPATAEIEQLPILSLAFSPENVILVTGHAGGQFSFSHLGRNYYFQSRRLPTEISNIEFSADSRRLLLAGKNSWLYNFDLRLLRLYSLPLLPSGFRDLEQLAETGLTIEQRALYDFIAAQMIARWRYEIEIDSDLPLGVHQYDIEL